jgi:vacuolar-type H+-ATPase subunit I/STV1
MKDQVNAFCQEKIQILKEYVIKGEELLSSIENWESLAGILAERDVLIERLQELETHFIQENGQIPYSEGQKCEINELIKLNAEIDQDIMRLLREEQNKTLQDLKTNHNNQKIARYEINLKPNYGNYLDTKK